MNKRGVICHHNTIKHRRLTYNFLRKLFLLTALILSAFLVSCAAPKKMITEYKNMTQPIKSLQYKDPQVINLNLLDNSFDDQVDTVRLLLRSIHDNSNGISSESVFELGLIRVSNKTVGIEWTMDFQVIWSKPLMDGPPGELKLVNWHATGDVNPRAGNLARTNAAEVLKTKIGSLIEPGKILHGKVEIISP